MTPPRNTWRNLRVFLAAAAFCILTAAVLVPRWLPYAFNTQVGSDFLAAIANFTVGGTIAFLSILLLTAVFGRFYCSILCPLGILQDILGHVHIGKRRFSPWKRRVRWPVFCLTATAALCGFMLPLTLLMPSSNFVAICNSVFREIIQKLNDAAPVLPEPMTLRPMPAVQIAGWLMFLALLALVQWRGRVFCNTLCPVGAVLGAFSRKALFRLDIDSASCIRCGACERACKAECIDAKNAALHYDECVLCLDCIGKCPKGALKYRRSSAQPAPFSPDRRQFVLNTSAVVASAAVGAATRLIPKPENNSILPVMPPGAGSMEQFSARCLGCGLCIGACQGKILKAAITEYGLRGFQQPVMDAYRGACDFSCNACTQICPCGALKPLTLEQKRRTRVGLAHWRQDLCVAFVKEEDCGACSEHCPVGALTMEDVPGKRAKVPQVNPDLCIGCGACQNICPIRPVAAIVVHGVSQQGDVLPPKETPDVKLSAEEDFPF